MPQQICEECVRRLTLTLNFRQDCHSSQEMLEQFFRNTPKIVPDPSNSFEFLNLDLSVKCEEKPDNQAAIQDIESVVELPLGVTADEPKSQFTAQIVHPSVNHTKNSCLELETANDDSNFEFNIYEDEICSSNVAFNEDENISDSNATESKLECDLCGKHYKREVNMRKRKIITIHDTNSIAGSFITSSC